MALKTLPDIIERFGAGDPLLPREQRQLSKHLERQLKIERKQAELAELVNGDSTIETPLDTFASLFERLAGKESTPLVFTESTQQPGKPPNYLIAAGLALLVIIFLRKKKK